LLPCWTQLLQDLAREASDPLPIRMMPWDVVTHWNSTFDMLVFTLEYRDTIDGITGNREMRKYELLEEEWGLVQQLGDVLQVCLAHFPILLLEFSQIFKDTTLFFSYVTPNLPTVIPAMDHINAHLATASKNLRLSPVLQALLTLSKAHLNKYYALTDHTEVYQIAMSESIPLIIVRITILMNSLTSTTQTSILLRGCL